MCLTTTTTPTNVDTAATAAATAPALAHLDKHDNDSAASLSEPLVPGLQQREVEATGEIETGRIEAGSVLSKLKRSFDQGAAWIDRELQRTGTAMSMLTLSKQIEKEKMAYGVEMFDLMCAGGRDNEEAQKAVFDKYAATVSALEGKVAQHQSEFDKLFPSEGRMLFTWSQLPEDGFAVL
jgi:hypothetical protein